MSFKNITKVLTATAGAAASLTAGASYMLFRQVIGRNAKLYPAVASAVVKQQNKNKPAAPAPATPDERNVWFNNQSFEEYSMVNDRGQSLRAYLLPADAPSDIYVFGSHGYRNHGRGEFNYMAKFYHDMGCNVFLVDHQSAGLSDGKYIGFGYYESADCLKWLDFMLKSFGADIQIILHGVSMGSATVMLMCGSAALPDNVKFAVADCGYTSAWNQFEYILNKAKVPVFPLLSGANAFSRIIAGYDFKDADALASVKRAKLPMLFIHGSTDDFVPTYMGKELFEACASPEKELLIVDGAMHAQSYRKDSTAYENAVRGFMQRYIKQA